MVFVILITLKLNRNGGGKDIFITGNLGEYNMTKLSDTSNDRMLLGENNEKSVLLWLLPGKYYYRFLVDGIEVLDDSRPVKLFKGKFKLVETIF
jgi:hypothetical protein